MFSPIFRKWENHLTLLGDEERLPVALKSLQEQGPYIRESIRIKELETGGDSEPPPNWVKSYLHSLHT